MLNKNEFRKFAVHNQGISGNTFDQYTTHIENMTRSVIEERPQNFREIDVFSRLIMDRTIFLGTPIDDHVANIIVAQLLFLENADKKEDIKMLVNTGGGSIYAGNSIIDLMNYVEPDISTIVTGIAASMGFVISTSGTKGKRFALKHARLMQHQPMSGVAPGTQASDMEITLREVNKLKRELYQTISDNTGQPYEKIEKDCDRDYWMTSQEALEYGAIDEILTKRK